MQPPQVDTAGSEQREALIKMMALGFAVDPISRWVWPDAATFFDNFPPFIAAMGGRAFEHDSAYATSCGRACALWLPPGIETDGDAIGEIVANTVPAERMEEIGGFFEQVFSYHPQEPHWYLPMIAADPFATGQGLGAALMKHALTVVDQAGFPAFLESSNPRNISLYERHGFEVIGEVKSETSPVMTPMLRAARG